jgi:hypothetical protein
MDAEELVAHLRRRQPLLWYNVSSLVLKAPVNFGGEPYQP